MLKVIVPSKTEFTEGDIGSVKEIFSCVKEMFFFKLNAKGANCCTQITKEVPN